MPEPTLLDPFPERLRAFGDFIRSLADCKLKAAQTELTEAVAAGQWTRVRVIETALAQLEHDFETLQRTQHQARHRIQELTEKAHAASMLLQGAPIAAFTHARDAYKNFERQALIEGDADLFHDGFPTTSITPDQFLDNDAPERPCQPLAASPATLNALQLMDWALTHHYLARPGSAAQGHFVDLFRQIAIVARRSLDAIRDQEEAITNRTYQVWQPLHILGLEPSAAEARILGATGPYPAACLVTPPPPAHP